MNLPLNPGNYTVVVSAGRICQNSGSSGNGFIEVYAVNSQQSPGLTQQLSPLQDSPQQASTGPASYSGCFQDKSSRVLGHQPWVNQQMTPSRCIEHCRDQGSKYAGIENGSECFCGNNDSYNQCGSAKCETSCGGDPGKKCGGWWAIDVYAVSVPSPLPSSPSREVTWDFETGNLKGWVREGKAFETQPTYGDNPAARNRETSRHQGNYWIGGYENRVRPGDPAGKTFGDGAKGTMVSPMFIIGENKISFLIGGGCNKKDVGIELLIGEQSVRQATGECYETMKPHSWDVSEFKGSMARIRIYDHASGGWGHINIDDIQIGSASQITSISQSDPMVPPSSSSQYVLDQFTFTPNAAISGHNKQHLTGVSSNACAQRCLQESWCQSFDYYKRESKCDLSDKNAAEVGGLKTNYSGNPYDHYAKIQTGGALSQEAPTSLQPPSQVAAIKKPIALATKPRQPVQPKPAPIKTTPAPAKLQPAPAQPKPAADTAPCTPASGVDLRHCSFAGKKLDGANFSKANLSGVSFKKASLRKAKFEGAQCQKTNFSHAKLEKASFKKAKCGKADFSKAKLEKANFRNADLRGTNFRKADVNKTSFKGAKLKGSNVKDDPMNLIIAKF